MTAQALSYVQRAELCENAAGQALLRLMEEKRTNLSIAADVTTAAELLEIADKLGPYICVLKTHIDILLDFDSSLPAKLTALAEKHNFMIFEDRKFADIGNTVMHQYRDGVYRIASWSHITNAHSVPGPGIIDGMKAVGLPLGRGLLMLAEMSSKGTLARGDYAEETVKMAKANKDFVFGFIAQRCMVPDDPSFVYLTPGVQLAAGGDALVLRFPGSQYNTPKTVILDRNCDVIIVGRGIYKADDPVAAAKAYQQAGWDAYQARLGSR